MATRPVPIRSLPGIKRDGTLFEGQNYVDALWCRFQRGLPRKIGGYRAVTSTIPEIARGMGSFSSNGTQFLYMGGATTLTQVQVDSQGLLLAQADRTPAGFAGNPDNLWQFDTMYNSVTTQTSVIAHAAPNLSNIDNTAVAPIYAGDAIGTAVLTDLGVAGESGGICVVPPFLFKFGTNGHIAWSAANDPATFNPADEAFIANGSKLVCGSRMRGGNAPSALFWSTDSLERANFTGVASPLWDFDTMAGESSILSAQGVVENDGLFFWPGVDRFLMFNGVVREVPNNLNINWFYDNVNFAQRQKVFGIKIPRWGEIWWLFPFGNATECTHAIIYNLREELWYDTALPASGRSTGIFAKVYAKPFMVDRALDPLTSQYTLWQHETGTDAINGSSVQPIPSYFETAEMSAVEQGTDKALHTDWIEPDFVQAGDMTVVVSGRSNPRAPDIASAPKTFPATATVTEQQTVPVKETRRLLRFRFQSNVAGGNYEMGQPLAHVDTGTGRKTT
jgi:hypothetical protein